MGWRMKMFLCFLNYSNVRLGPKALVSGRRPGRCLSVYACLGDGRKAVLFSRALAFDQYFFTIGQSQLPDTNVIKSEKSHISKYSQ